jgi:hypothetical protein
MTDRLPAADLRNMVAALRAERTAMLDFTSTLSDDEWTAPNAAKEWRNRRRRRPHRRDSAELLHARRAAHGRHPRDEQQRGRGVPGVV